MKVLFLDFDGVLNHYNYHNLSEFMNRPLWFCEYAMENLDKIIKNTGTYIVLSTSHRVNPSSVEKFKNECRTRGWGDIIIGSTPDLHNRAEEYSGVTRSEEIKKYIDTRCDIENWAIIDDIHIFLDNFVEINHEIGLTRSDSDKIINILNKTTHVLYK